MSLRRIIPLPRRAPDDIASVVRAIGALVGRHSSLRTRLRLAGGDPAQLVAASGELSVRLVRAGSEGDCPTAAQAAADELAAAPFDHAGEWPQRFALVLDGERVRQIVAVFSHTTVDFHAVEMVLRDLRLLLLRGAINSPPPAQSVDIAGREQGPERAESDRAVSYWLGSHARLPRTVLAPTATPLTPRFRRAVLTSPAADTAVRLIANQHRVTTSAVLLAAATAVIGAWSGVERCGIHTMTSNRARAGYADAIAKLNQLGLLVIDLADRPRFADLLPRVWQAALRAYRHAHYDPTRMEQELETAGYSYPPEVNPHCYLNDIRLATDADLYGRATGEADVRAALAKSTFAWAERLARFSWCIRIEIVDMPAAIGIALTADTSYLPPLLIEQFLRDYEWLLVEAAFGDLRWPWLPARDPVGRRTDGWG